jgi:hypothetical protein
VNNNGLAINGTVTRTPVATGADLVAYSGFTSSNYLEQPYNSDLDFGTGDFCIMGWVKTADGNGDIIIRGDAALSGVWFAVGISSTLPRVFVVDTGTDSCSGSNAVNTDTWVHIVGLRRLGVLELFVDGVLANTLSQTSDLDNTSATLQVGSRQGGANPLSGSLALWRISATAPTAEQIAKIYEDEKVLFQEGAQATLYGASDAVTALAHDPELNLLHVGTSAGRSVFQGLRRVSNTTTAVGTAISASNGLVVEE